jgi:hypothetical protein
MTRIFFELDQLNYLHSILITHESNNINKKLLTKVRAAINRINKLLSTP